MSIDNSREYEVLRDAILKVLQVYIKEVTPESTFREDLGADSLDMLQIMQLVEGELGISIGEVDASTVKTVNDALMLIDKAKR